MHSRHIQDEAQRGDERERKNPCTCVARANGVIKPQETLHLVTLCLSFCITWGGGGHEIHHRCLTDRFASALMRRSENDEGKQRKKRQPSDPCCHICHHFSNCQGIACMCAVPQARLHPVSPERFSFFRLGGLTAIML